MSALLPSMLTLLLLGAGAVVAALVGDYRHRKTCELCRRGEWVEIRGR